MLCLRFYFIFYFVVTQKGPFEFEVEYHVHKTHCSQSQNLTFLSVSWIGTVRSYPNWKDRFPRSPTEASRFAFLQAAKNYNTDTVLICIYTAPPSSGDLRVRCKHSVTYFHVETDNAPLLRCPMQVAYIHLSSKHCSRFGS